MKRILAFALTVMLLLAVLSGCRMPQGENPQNPSEETPPDITEPTPGQQPTSPPHKEPLFQYDPHKITPDGRSYLTEHEYALYCKMIDSILAHDGVVEGFASYDEFFKIWGVLLQEFVPVRGIVQTYGNSEEPFLYESGMATLRFVGDRETCDRNYAALADIINEALSLLQEDDSDWERIAKLYLYVSDHMVYGSPYETYGVEANLNNCILYQLGICADYAYYLNLLASQIGFETIVGRSLGIEGLADHAWSMIRVEGQWYHFDACWEASRFSHEDMTFFAFKAQNQDNTLASSNPWGITGEIEIFNQHDYTNEQSELPYCESGMGAEERQRLYHSVFDEYMQGISGNITTDIEEYIDAAYNEILKTAAGQDLGICFEIKPGTLTSTVRGIILTYSPEDLVNYPLLDDGSVRCKYHSIVLTHIDQTDPKSIMFFILHEDVVQQSVKFVVV